MYCWLGLGLILYILYCRIWLSLASPDMCARSPWDGIYSSHGLRGDQLLAVRQDSARCMCTADIRWLHADGRTDRQTDRHTWSDDDLWNKLSRRLLLGDFGASRVFGGEGGGVSVFAFAIACRISPSLEKLWDLLLRKGAARLVKVSPSVDSQTSLVHTGLV